MPSTYTLNLGLEKPATGEQAGVWGATVNKTFDFLDTSTDGNVTVPLSASAYTLITNQGVDSEGRNKVITFTGNLGTDGSILISPSTAEKIYFVTNHTTGGFALNFSQGTGPVFKLLNNRSAIIYSNGLGGAAGVFGCLADHQVNSLLVQTNLIVQGQINWGGTSAVIDKPATFSGLATFSAGATIQAPLTVNLGGDAPFDLYYRSGGGSLARLAIGSSGQILTASGGGPSWAAGFQPFYNMVISGSADNLIFYASGGGHMVQSGNLQFVNATGQGLGMAPNRALSIGGNYAAVVQLDASDSHTARGLLFSTNNVPRWSLETSVDGEGGGNTGSHLRLRSAVDAGSPVIDNLVSYRSGRTTVGNVYNDSYNYQFTVVNTSGSGYIQAWVNSAGTQVASVDNAGNFVSTSSGGFLKLNAQNRLDINGTVAGHPLGVIHVGADSFGSTGGPNPAIVLEGAVQFGNPVLGGNSVRMYVRTSVSPKFVIQFASGGQDYYAYLDLLPDTGGTPHSWFITHTPAQ